MSVRAKAVVSTLPAHALRGVLDDVMPDAAPLFDELRTDVQRTGIYHPPVYAVTVAYPKAAFRDVELPNGFGNLRDLPGFGSLNPRTEGVRTLGTETRVERFNGTSMRWSSEGPSMATVRPRQPLKTRDDQIIPREASF